MSKAVFTWASGDGFCELKDFKVFLKSLEIVDADKIIFTHEMSPAIQRCLEEQGLTVHRVNPSDVGYPIGDRHLHYWRHLCRNPYDYVLHVDSRDVVFQTDPFQFAESSPFVMLVNEGMPTTANGFHLIEQLEFQKDVPQTFKRDPRANFVLNGGVALGTGEAMKAHFILIWAMSIKMTPNVTDQATLNYLYNFLKDDPAYRVAPELFCLTGEAVKDGFSEAEFRDGTFYLKGQPYSLVHQWDRTEYAQEILSHYLQ